jgi:uncharacterized membrane protein
VNQKEKNEYIVPFKGAKLNKREANQTGFGIIAGVVGMVAAFTVFGTSHKLYSIILVGLFAVIGFLGYGYFQKRKRK